MKRAMIISLTVVIGLFLAGTSMHGGTAMEWAMVPARTLKR